MQSRWQNALAVAAVAAVLAGGYAVGRAQHGRGPADALVSVPPGAWLVATIDVGSLRASPLAAPLLGATAATAVAGLGNLTDACGFDPVTRVDRVVVCAPEAGERGDFGVAVTGALSAGELARCADRVIRARSGEPATTTRGTFTVVTDDAAPTRARVAYREGGPFLVGRGAWLDAMIDASDGKTAGAGPEHAELRAAMQAPGGTTAPSLVVTALLPASVRQRLRGELGAEPGSEGEQAYAAVLAVRAAGVAVTTGAAGSSTEVRAELRCEGAEACGEVQKLILRRRLGLEGNLGLRLVGLGPLVDSLAVAAEGASITMTARAPTDDLGRALKRLVDGRGAKGAATPKGP